MTRLAEMLRLYRAVNARTTRELAKEIGTSAATLSRLERGFEIDMSTFMKLLLWMLAKRS